MEWSLRKNGKARTTCDGVIRERTSGDLRPPGCSPGKSFAVTQGQGATPAPLPNDVCGSAKPFGEEKRQQWSPQNPQNTTTRRARAISNHRESLASPPKPPLPLPLGRSTADVGRCAISDEPTSRPCLQA